MKRSRLKLKLLDLDSLRQIRLVSNTPAYLYKHFRRNGSLQRFADSCSATDLAEMLDSLEQRKRKTGNYEITLYAIAVALSLKDYSEVRTLLNRLSKFDIKWMPEIKQLVSELSTVTQIQTFDLQFRTVNPAHFESHSSTTIADNTNGVPLKC